MSHNFFLVLDISLEKVFWNIIQNSHEGSCDEGNCLFKKKHYIIDTFIWNLQSLSEILIYRTPPGNCFCILWQ